MSKRLCFLISLVLVLCLFGNAWGLVWGQKDIGNPGIPGSASEAAGTWTIQGSGHDIWGNSDGFYYVYRPLSGDGSLQVNLVSMDVTSYWAKVGPMIRETLQSGSKHAMTAMTGAHGIQFVWRVNTNQSSDHVVRGGEFPPKELRIRRSGDEMISEFNYEWLPGLFMWTEIGRITIPMNTDVTIGMVVCATNNAALNTAVLEDVILIAPPYEKPWDLSPEDGTTRLPLTTTLSWMPGDSAALHDVYFGTDPAALPLVATKALGDESYIPYTPLDEGTVYYWQIVEQPLHLGQAGPIMSFSTERDIGAGLIDRCIWEGIGGVSVADLTGNPAYPDSPTWCDLLNKMDSPGFSPDKNNYGGRMQGLLTPETSGNYTFWIAADDGCELWLSPNEKACEAVKIAYWTGWTSYHAYDSEPEQKSAAIPLVGGQKYFIRALWKEGVGLDHCSVAWEGPDSPSRTEIDGYYLIPGYVELEAGNPNPADGATDVPLDVVLSWGPGFFAADVNGHDVYFGTDFNDVYTRDMSVYRGSQDANSYDPPGELELSQTYYWAIDEVNSSHPDSPWPGPVWRFTVQNVYYVDANATGANDGSSWDDAFIDLQDALTVVQDGDDIRVAEGTYTPDRNSADPNGSGDRTATFQLINGVAIYGGFPSGGGVWEDRDPNAYETILSGDINTPGDANDNSYHVVTGSGTAANAILDGFTITGGYANGSSLPDNRGGGMLNMSSSPTVSNCVFISNRAYGGAGGMYNNDSSPTLSHCDFNDNAAQFAGAMMNCQDSRPTLTNCTFSDNEALYALGGYPYGGGVYNIQSSPTLSNCTFQGNSSEAIGGGMYNYDTSLSLTNCIFSGNTAGYDGGAINNQYGSDITISNCIFSGNSAVGNDGGGMNNDSSSPTITNCIFIGNSAYDWGGGMRNIYYSSPTVTNCTFSGNTANSGAGIYNYSYSSPKVTNCIFWDDTPDEIFINYYSSPTVTYSDVQGGWSGTGNMNEDPCFVDADGLDDIFGTEDDDLQLLSGSPCVDKGDNSALPADTTDLDGDGNTAEPIPFDLEGNTRIVDGNNNGNPVVDMGAYEMVGNSVPVACIVDSNWVIEGQGPWGASVTLDGSCSSDADSTPGTNDDINDFDWFEQIDPCDPNSDIFLGTGEIIECNLPLGEHDIILEVIDKIGAFDSNEVTITVEDTTPPVLNCPADITLEATGPDGAMGTFAASATDLCDEAPTITFDPFSGSTFGLGTTNVNCTATDSSGNSSSCVFSVTVVDTTPPEFTNAPEDMTVECDGAGNSDELSSWLASAAAEDLCGEVTITHDFAGLSDGCGATGSAIVTWTATDESGNKSSTSATFAIVDTAPPVIELIGEATVTVECHSGTYTELGAVALDDCDSGPIEVIIGGDVVDVNTSGTYVVTYNAVDDCGNDADQVTRAVEVVDNAPPEFSLSVEPNVLWPPNHTMVLITPSWEINDNCDEWPEVTLLSITSSEEDNAKGDGDGDTTGDILVDPNDGSIYLRAERSGTGSGRIYTITYEAVDGSNNVTVDIATVTVPHDQRRHRHRYRERTGERNTKGQ